MLLRFLQFDEGKRHQLVFYDRIRENCASTADDIELLGLPCRTSSQSARIEKRINGCQVGIALDGSEGIFE